MIPVAVLCVLASSIILSSAADKKLVCYYESWAVYRNGDGGFPVSKIDPSICTHLVYCYASLKKNTIQVSDSWHDVELNGLQSFTKLKKVNPNLKTMIAIGGWNGGSTKFSAMASSRETRKIFIDSVIEFLERWGFDGLDMDWEYPGSRGGKPEDKANFVLLLKELKEAFKPSEYLLTAAVCAGKAIMDVAYNIREISKYLDIINVMTFDYHGGWEKFTGHNSPLYARPEETGNERLLNINYTIHYWIDQGAPREKLVIGLSLYGRSFTLQRAEEHGLAAPVSGVGRPGPYTNEPGLLGYNEICKFIIAEEWTVVWVDHYEAPYAYKDHQWVGYDDPRSVKIKAQFAKDLRLGGCMVWSIDTDYVPGNCGSKRFPLINTIRETLRRPKEIALTKRPKPTQQPKSNLGPSDNLACTSSGWFRDPNDCASYWRCYKTLGGYGRQQLRCLAGTIFDLKSSGCNWPKNAGVEDCLNYI